MAKAQTKTPKSAGGKTGKSGTTAKKTRGKTGSKEGTPAATAPVYNPIGSMSPTQLAAFPTADFVIVVELPSDLTTGPVFSTLAGAKLKPVRTDLAGRSAIPPNNPTAVQLMPKTGELLQIIYPDGTTAACVSRPRWFWVGLPVTQL